MISIAVLAESLHLIHRPIVPLDRVINQSSKAIHLLGNQKNYEDSKNDRNEKKILFHSTVNSNVSLKNKHHDLFKNLENPIENAKRDSSYLNGINQFENFTHLKGSPIHSNKMNLLKRASNRSHHSKLVPSDLKDKSHLFRSAPANFHASYSPGNHLPISYYTGPQKHIVTKIERNTLHTQREKDYMPLERVQWFEGRSMNPHYAKDYQSKSVDGQITSDKQFGIDYEEPSGKSSPVFKEHTLIKPSYGVAKHIPQYSGRLQSYQSELFSNEDNDSQYPDASSSKEFQIPNRGSYLSFQNYKSPQTELNMQLPKNSYSKLEQNVDHVQPSFHLLPSFEKPRNSDSHLQQEFHFKSPRHFLPHQKGLSSPSKSFEMSTNSNNQLAERSVVSPIQPSFRSYQEHSQNSHLGKPRHFKPEDSGEGTLSKPSRSTEISSEHRPFSDEFPLDLIRPHYQENLHDHLFISDKGNFQSYLPNQEHQQSSDSNQSGENVYSPPHLNMENDKRKDSNYNPNNYSSDEDILAERVKELLNPPGIPVEENSPHSGNNLSFQSHQSHFSPIINHPITDDDIGRDNYIKNSTASERDGDIAGFESDPEPDSEPESEDNKDGISEEEHDGFLDMGGYADKQGSFGWYADFPVGRGHDKVSYSSS